MNDAIQNRCLFFYFDPVCVGSIHCGRLHLLPNTLKTFTQHTKSQTFDLHKTNIVIGIDTKRRGERRTQELQQIGYTRFVWCQR